MSINPAPVVSRLDDETAAHLSAFFGALSDPSRLRILALLIDGPHNVGALAEAVGLTEPAVSHHLRSLRHLRIVRATKKGRQVFYSLDDDHVEGLIRQGLEHIVHER